MIARGNHFRKEESRYCRNNYLLIEKKITETLVVFFLVKIYVSQFLITTKNTKR